MRERFTRSFAPVGEKGDGVAKVKGFVLFVPNTKEGDEVKVRITRVLRKVGFAEVIGEGSVPKEQPEEGEQPAEETEEAPEEEPQDTEDFGEEPEEDKNE